jgi:hypothetical protein
VGTSASWIEQQFHAAIGKHKITSPRDSAYNCIAWAAIGSTAEWWTHLPGYKWPGEDRTPLIESLVKVFVSVGYSEKAVDDHSVESGVEKVALYAKNGIWRHAARQLPNGKWTSKLGPDEDIEHDTPECLCGDSYGTIHCIMRKAAR